MPENTSNRSRNKPDRAARNEDAQVARENVDRKRSGNKDRQTSIEEFESKVDLPGKTDSGPEPDVFGREIPPQK